MSYLYVVDDGATLSVDINKTPKLSNNTLTIPAQSFVILEIVD